MTQHTLAAGSLPSAKLKRLLGGFSGVNMIPPLNRTYNIFYARGGNGKSTLLQSIPGSFYFNIDNSSTVVPNPPALVWPGQDPTTGSPVEACEPGTPNAYQCPALGGLVRRIDITWADILAKKDQILELAAKSPADAPDCVTFDTVTSCIPLMMEYGVSEAQRKAIIGEKSKTIESWDDLNTMNKWSSMYDDYVALIKEFRRAGIGVNLGIHIVDKFVNLDQTRKVWLEGCAQITDAFKQRIENDAQLIGVLEVKEEQEKSSQQVNGPDGKPLFDKDKKPVMVPVYTAVRRGYVKFESGTSVKLGKGRGISGTVLLPKHNAWAALQAAYDTEMAKLTTVPSPTTP